MNDNIKKAINKEYSQLLPPHFEARVKKKILNAIFKPLPWYKRIRKEDLMLFLALVFFSFAAYYLLFDPNYRIKVSMPKDWLRNIGLTLSTCIVLIYLLINEHFENKKKIQF